MMLEKTDEYWMRMALKEAQNALLEDEVPIGAVVVCNQQLIAKGYNQVERLKDVTAHAEMIAITAAANYLGAKFLEDCTLYVTLEPCPMCAAALRWARIGKIVFGANDLKTGFLSKELPLLHPKTTVEQGVLAHECGRIITTFFSEKRALN